MSNKNKILVGCLALLLALSVGYALFSDTITINGTATAKGEFATSMTCGITDDNQIMYDTGLGSSGEFEGATITCENSVVTSQVTFTRPGSRMLFYVEVENTGTIPYKLKSVEDLDTGDIVDVNNPSTSLSKESGGKGVYMSMLPDGLGWNEPDENGYIEPGYITFVEGWANYIFENIITPGGKQIFYIESHWSDLKNQPDVGDGVSVTGRFKLNFEQVTN